jgi:FdhE protein
VPPLPHESARSETGAGKGCEKMISDMLIDNPTTDVNGAPASICSRLPGLKDVAGAFAALIHERRSMDLESVGWPGPVAFDAAAFGSGTPLLANLETSGLQGCFLASAKKLLPVLERAFPSISARAAALRTALKESPDLADRCLEPVFTYDSQGLQRTARTVGIDVETLSFLVLEILKPCLRRAAKEFAHLADNEL